MKTLNKNSIVSLRTFCVLIIAGSLGANVGRGQTPPNSPPSIAANPGAYTNATLPSAGGSGTGQGGINLNQIDKGIVYYQFASVQDVGESNFNSFSIGGALNRVKVMPLTASQSPLYVQDCASGNCSAYQSYVQVVILNSVPTVAFNNYSLFNTCRAAALLVQSNPTKYELTVGVLPTVGTVGSYVAPGTSSLTPISLSPGATVSGGPWFTAYNGRGIAVPTIFLDSAFLNSCNSSLLGSTNAANAGGGLPLTQ